jgi:hypothetical protein
MRIDFSTRVCRLPLIASLAFSLALALPAQAPAQADTLEHEALATAQTPETPEAPEPPEPPRLQEEGDWVHVLGGNRTIGEDESVRDVLVVGGNLAVRGEVRGDAVVVGGNLTLHPTGRIAGDVVVAGGRFRDQGGFIGGERRTMDRVPGLAARVEREVRTERARGMGFGRITRGFAGVVSTLALTLVLAAVGAVLVFYGNRYLETVSDTVRGSTLRSGAVGLAAAFLIVPAFVVMVVALAVSIVGIPILLLAIPLYPLAVAAAAVFGLLASAYAIGERTSEQRKPFDFRHRNGYAYLGIGLVVLFAPVVMGHLVGITPFLGWIGSLIKFFAYAVIWVAITIGMGAVILSRGGTRRTFAAAPPPPHDPMLEEDPFLESSDV